MSFAPVFNAAFFAPISGDFSGRRLPRRELPRGTHRPGPPARAAVAPDHPVLFMGGFLLAVSFAVIGLWQGMGLLLPH